MARLADADLTGAGLTSADLTGAYLPARDSLRMCPSSFTMLESSTQQIQIQKLGHVDPRSEERVSQLTVADLISRAELDRLIRHLAEREAAGRPGPSRRHRHGRMR